MKGWNSSSHPRRPNHSRTRFREQAKIAKAGLKAIGERRACSLQFLQGNQRSLIIKLVNSFASEGQVFHGRTRSAHRNGVAAAIGLVPIASSPARFEIGAASCE